jgi:hypothetical protein
MLATCAFHRGGHGVDSGHGVNSGHDLLVGNGGIIRTLVCAVDGVDGSSERMT